MLHWSPDLKGHAIIARKLSLNSASLRVEMQEGSEPSMKFAPADMRPTAYRVPVGDGAAGHGDREPSSGFFEERARAM